MKKILIAVLLFTVLLGVRTALTVEDLKIPGPAPTRPLYYGDCCCGESERLLNRIYENQLINEARDRPSTLEEIEDTFYKLSRGRSD